MDRKLISRHDSGTTLVELLVVVAVLSVLAVGVTLMSVRTPNAPSLQDQNRFADTYARIQDLAIQGRATYGISVSAQGFQALILDAGRWETRGPEQAWSGRVTVTGGALNQGGRAPDIVLLPSGQNSPFALQFSNRSANGGRCESTGWGDLICE